MSLNPRSLAKLLYSIVEDKKNAEAKERIGAFVRALSTRGWSGLLPDIINALPEAIREHEGKTSVTIESARPLSEKTIVSAMEKIGIAPKNAEILLKENSDLIAGMRLRTIDILLDVTVRGRLEKLKEQLH